MEAATFWDRVAVTDTLFREALAKALHISEVPFWAFVRTARTHVSPAPDTLRTVVLGWETTFVAMKASSSSFPDFVEKEGDVIVALAVDRSRQTPTSGAIEELVWFWVAVKVTPVTFVPFTVTELLVGENEYPALLGVTVYVPFAMPAKVKLPEPSAVVFAPLFSFRLVPAPSVDGLMEPETLQVVCCAVAVKLTPVTFPPFTVTDLLAGENVYPVLAGVTV
jgi:hypothetical protein